MKRIRVAFAVVIAIASIAAIVGTDAIAVAPAPVTKIIDLTNTSVSGLARSLSVTLYRDGTSSEKRPLVVLIPQLGGQITDTPYAQQAEFFVVVALPHLTGIYNDGVELPVYTARTDADLVADTAPFAVEVLAVVADLSGTQGPSTQNHIIVGEGFGSVVAARYAALGVPGCKGIVLLSAGFGRKRSAMSSLDDMRASEAAFGQLGAKVTVPSLWLYAKDNTRISEVTENDLLTAYKATNSGARLVSLPGIGMDGDVLFSKADPQATWGEAVSAFLHSIQMN